MKLIISILVSIFFAATISLAKEAQTTGEKIQTKTIMHSLFEAVSTIIPLSISDTEFRSKENQQKVTVNLQKLALHAQILESHAKSKDKSFQFISRSLAKDTRDILHWYKLKRYDEAQYIFNNLTENCIACHSQKSGPENLPETAKFFQYVKIKNLPLLEKAQMQVAMRQFDDALKNYEAFFSSPEFSPAQLALMEAFTDYLKLSIRVKGDLQRPIPVLENWAKREGVPEFMRVNIREWVKALKEINAKKLFTSPEIPAARNLISLAQKDLSLSMDRSKLVYFVSASGLLMRLVSSPNLSPKEFGEAYYLLGICESVIGQTFWISQTDFFLEAAIRSAPGSEIAKKSYALLEEQIVYEFSGSSGTHIPEDMEQLLKELKGLSR